MSVRRGKRNPSKKEYFSDCLFMSMDILRGRHSEFPINHALWFAQLEVYNFYDGDNLVALLKWPIDFLKARGVIIDDSPKHFWPLRYPRQSSRRRVSQRMLYLEVWPVTKNELQEQQGDKRYATNQPPSVPRDPTQHQGKAT